MPVLTTNADNLTFTAPNQQWIVQSGVLVGSPNAAFGAVSIGFAEDELINNGIVFVPSNIQFGGIAVVVTAGANGTVINNSNTGAISGLTGISVNAANVHVTNAGSIIGFAGVGVAYNSQPTGSDLTNSGYIYGKTVAVTATLLPEFTLTNSGVIASDGQSTIALLINGKMTLTNTGKIIAAEGQTAIVAAGSGATVQLVNQGVIRGEVSLSDGADTFDGRGGVTRGVVFGANGADTLTGGGSSDELRGDNGRDTINGRGSGDVLIGGAAGDTLTGGNGGDDFVYRFTSDSNGNTAGTRDTIIDFDPDGDRIDLRPLDAMLGNGNQKFDFIGTNAFTGKKGQLRYEVDAGNAVVQADVTGDGKADLAILLTKVTTLSGGDFFL